MDETTGTPNLNRALAAFQAEAPKVIKDEVGIIPGKDRKQGYKYRYADLATVNAVALPLLGKHGLSVFAKPGFAGNQFGIVCKLKHSSGEEEEGFYPLPSASTPQQMGSAITYARRYSMLMMTGLAPADEDDDAAAVNTTQQFAPQSAGEAFQSAAPAPPRNGSGRPANGTAGRPERGKRPAAHAPEGAETDIDWMGHLVDDLIPAATTRGELLGFWDNVQEHVTAGKCSDDHAKEILAMVTTRASELGFEKAPAA
jgi:hypothetical protein